MGEDRVEILRLGKGIFTEVYGGEEGTEERNFTEGHGGISRSYAEMEFAEGEELGGRGGCGGRSSRR